MENFEKKTGNKAGDISQLKYFHEPHEEHIIYTANNSYSVTVGVSVPFFISLNISFYEDSFRKKIFIKNYSLSYLSPKKIHKTTNIE